MIHDAHRKCGTNGIALLSMVENIGHLYESWQMTYKVVSKIFETGAAIYTAVVVVRSTGRW